MNEVDVVRQFPQRLEDSQGQERVDQTCAGNKFLRKRLESRNKKKTIPFGIPKRILLAPYVTLWLASFLYIALFGCQYLQMLR